MVSYGYEDLPGRGVCGQDWGPQEHGQSRSRSGKLPDRRTPAGHRHCTDADRYFDVQRDEAGAGPTVVYCRVSSRAQQDDLRTQQQVLEAFCLGAGLAVDEWLTEIGGGLDFKRPVFRALMERVGKGEVGLLVVAHGIVSAGSGLTGSSISPTAMAAGSAWSTSRPCRRRRSWSRT